MRVGKTQPARARVVCVPALLVALLLLAACGNQDAGRGGGSDATTPPAPAAQATIGDRPASQFVLRKDMFEALTNPALIPADEADWMSPSDLVLGYAEGAEARAYPLRQMAYHHVVNDVVDHRPVLVTYCSLSGNACVFDRKAEEQIDEFGVAGWFQGTLLLYDKRTGSTWSQVTGRCLDGFRKGEVLRRVARGRIVEWQAWCQRHASARVLRPRPEWEDRYPGPVDYLPGASYVPAGLKPSIAASQPAWPRHQLLLGFEEDGLAYAVHLPPVAPSVRMFRAGSRVLLAWRVTGAFDVRLFVFPSDLLPGTGEQPMLQPVLQAGGTLRVGAGDLVSVFTSEGECLSGLGAGTQLAPVACVLIEDYAWRVHHPELRTIED